MLNPSGSQEERTEAVARNKACAFMSSRYLAETEIRFLGVTFGASIVFVIKCC